MKVEESKKTEKEVDSKIGEEIVHRVDEVVLVGETNGREEEAKRKKKKSKNEEVRGKTRGKMGKRQNKR